MTAGGFAEAPRLAERGLGLALEILEQVARHHEGVSAADIARAVGAPRATVYRVVNSLVRDEYLVRRPDFSGFVLGARVLELAAVVDAHRRPAYRDVLDRVRADTGEAVHLVAFHSAGLVIVDEDPLRPISDRELLLSDPTRSAIGHLWLVDRPSGPEPRQSPRFTVAVSPGDVSAIAEAVAVRGYAEQVGMLSPDRGCLAVPIRSETDELIGAVTLSTTLPRLSLAARHVSALRRAAASLAEVDALISA